MSAIVGLEYVLVVGFEYMKNSSILFVVVMMAIGVFFTSPERIISYELSSSQDRNITSKMQEQKSNTTAEVPSSRGYAYRLQVKVEGLDQDGVNVYSKAITPTGMTLANGSGFIDTGFETKTIYVYLLGNHSALVSQFYTCAVKFNGPELCQYTITEGELVGINFNALGK